MSEDIWEDPNTKLWVQQVMDDTVPKIRGSAATLSIVPGGEGDVQFWVQLGASIMLDKPIIAIAFNDRDIPDRLRLVADEIVVIPDGVSPEASEELAEAIKRVIPDG